MRGGALTRFIPDGQMGRGFYETFRDRVNEKDGKV